MRGTPGQHKIPETELRDPLLIEPVPFQAADIAQQVATHRGDILLHKPGLDVFRWNPNAEAVLTALAPDRVVLYGVATDFCVLAAVVGIRRLLPQGELVVVRDAIAAIDAAVGQGLCASWSASGIIMSDTAAVTT